MNLLSRKLLSSHLTVLLDESKLSIFQRQQIQNTVRNGEPLPPLSSGRSVSSSVQASTSTNIKRHVFHKKRTRDAIISSGAYEDSFIPTHPGGTMCTFFYIYKIIIYKSLAVISIILISSKSNICVGRMHMNFITFFDHITR
jgi:hypothetical protein